MTVPGRERPRRPRPARRRPAALVAKALLVVVVFAVGVALGQALEENPDSGESVTYERTLRVPAETVTVTVPG